MFQTFSLSHQTGQGALRTYLKPTFEWGNQLKFLQYSLQNGPFKGTR